MELRVEMHPAGTERMVVALATLVALALAVWATMDSGRYRTLTWVLLAFFGFRVVLGRLRSR